MVRRNPDGVARKPLAQTGFWRAAAATAAGRVVARRQVIAIVFGLSLALPAWAQKAPENQARFTELVDQARRSYTAAPHELAKTQIRAARAQQLCATIFPRDASLSVTGWVGIIEKITSTGNGAGGLSVRISRDMHVRTHVEGVGDIGYATLIQPKTVLYEKLMAARNNQPVQFSGNFFKGSRDCIREASLTENGSMTEPEFIFKFSDIGHISR